MGPRKPKGAERIAHEIERDIAARGWPVGLMIGGESALLQRYGVSRAVLREAVGLLEHNRVARMRRGPGGGLVVDAPVTAVASGAIATHFAFVGIAPEEISVARECLDLISEESEDNPVLAIFADALDRTVTTRVALSDGQLGLALDRIAWVHTPDGEGSKLASRVAQAIKDEIVAIGRVPGDFLASEAELVEVYGVDRGVIRESVRILEYNGVAVMRPGPGGGLIVGDSDPARVQARACDYLLYAGVSRRAIFDARCAVELTAAELAAESIGEHSIPALRAVLAEAAGSDGEGAAAAAARLHVAIAELGGNRVIGFFVAILTRLSLMLVRRGAYTGEARATVERLHAEIVEAIAIGEGNLARRAMRRQLEVLMPLLVAPAEPIKRVRASLDETIEGVVVSSHELDHRLP